MKKIISLLLISAMLFTFSSCSNKLDGEQFRYEVGEYEAYYINFHGNTLEVSHNYYDYDPGSISGKYINNALSSTDTYTIEIIDSDHFECAGTTYAYTVSDSGTLTVVPDLLGIASYWGEG